MFKRLSLKRQFAFTFATIIVCSILTIIIIYALIIVSVIYKGEVGINPANFYEKKIPDIQIYIKENNLKLLDEDFQSNLEDKIPLEGISYEVVDFNKGKLYGNLDVNIENKKDIVDKFNKANTVGKEVTLYTPLIQDDFIIKGVAILRYKLVITPKDNNKILSLMPWVLLATPFVFIIIYTIVFGRKISKDLNKPLKELILASEKIKNYDLDFTLAYPYNNEIGQVINAFEDMRFKLKETLENKWKVEKEKRDMISSLSHDLRTPLTVVKGHVEILKDGAYKNQERLVKYLDIIESASERAVILVEDLNTLSKVDNGDFKLKYEKENIVNFLENKIREYDVLAANNLVDLEYNIKNIKEDSFFDIDKLRLTEVLDNLVANSFRYTEEGGTISILVEEDIDKVNF